MHGSSYSSSTKSTSSDCNVSSCFGICIQDQAEKTVFLIDIYCKNVSITKNFKHFTVFQTSSFFFLNFFVYHVLLNSFCLLCHCIQIALFQERSSGYAKMGNDPLALIRYLLVLRLFYNIRD